MGVQKTGERKLGFAQRRDIVLALLVIAAVMIFQLVKPSETIQLQFGQDSMTLSSSDGEAFLAEVRYSDILSLTQTEELEAGTCLTGADTDRYRFGTWRNGAYGEYTLCVFPSVSQYIVVETRQGVVVFNCEDAATTRSMYTAFAELLEEKRQEG